MGFDFLLLQGYAPIVQLSLPVVNNRKVDVSSSGQASYANADARQAAPDLWSTLESAVVPGGDAVPATWLSNGSRASLTGTQDMTYSCCVGEDVGVDVELTNPLHIELAITHLRLSCTFEAAPSKAPPPAQAQQVAKPETSPFQVREERITLHPGERAVIHLRVTPLRTGKLHIGGVVWTLNGVATGQMAFSIPRQLPKKTSSAALASDGEEAPQPEAGGIDVKVMPPMPRLKLSLEGLPSSLLAGQVAQCTLRLKNAGAMTLHALRMSTDAPTLFLESPSITTVQRPEAIVFTLGQSKLGVNEELEVAAYVR